MKKYLLLIGLLLILGTGCTAETPGAFYIVDAGGNRVSTYPIIGSTNSTLVDTDGNALSVDEATRAIITISLAHHEIHSGSSYFTQASDLALADEGTLVLAFKTPDTTEWGHFIATFITNGDANLDGIEGATWDNQSGSQNPIYNRNRNPGNSSAMLEDESSAGFLATDNVILNPTSLAGGTIIDSVYTFGEKEKAEGGTRGVLEWILKQDTQYAIRVTNNAGGENKIQLKLNWYEHTNK